MKPELSTKRNSSSKVVAQNSTPWSYQFFDRHGGVSKGVFTSFNVGYHVGDQDEAVQENRKRIKENLAVPLLLSAKQVHGTDIFCMTEKPTSDLEVEGYDALITDFPGVGLMIQQADCQAVLLFDPVKEVIAAVHCGWRGSVQGILQKVIEAMVEKYGTIPKNLQAVISPSLGPCCAEFINYKEELPVEFHEFMVQDNYFDFWSITRYQLTGAGMSPQRIEAAEICTCCSDDYFSYRRATRLQSKLTEGPTSGVTGRNCSVIVLGK